MPQGGFSNRFSGLSAFSCLVLVARRSAAYGLFLCLTIQGGIYVFMDTDKTSDNTNADGKVVDVVDVVDVADAADAARDATTRPARTDMPREINGPKGPEPTRYGDWEQKGRCSDF